MMQQSVVSNGFHSRHFLRRKSFIDNLDNGKTAAAATRRLRKQQKQEKQNGNNIRFEAADNDEAAVDRRVADINDDNSLLALLNWMIMPPTINMAVMGASGCGKTSIVNQFLYCQYSPLYQTTARPTLYELHLYDCPAISTDTFENPAASLENTLFNGNDGGADANTDPQDAIVDAARLRAVCRANAYVLVFDLTMPVTFDYIRSLRGIIMRRHVAAVKAAAVATAAAAAAVATGGISSINVGPTTSSSSSAAIAAAMQDQHGLIVPGGSVSVGAVGSMSASSTSNNPNLNVAARSTPPVIIVLGAKLDNCQRATSHMSATTANMDSTGQLRTNRFRREVTKQWKAPYMEVSARYNCNIFNAFKTLAREVDGQQNGRKTAERLLDNVRRKQCIIC